MKHLKKTLSILLALALCLARVPAAFAADDMAEEANLVFYVMGDEDWLSVGISRALLSVPGHYAFAVLMGYYYSVYHFVDHKPMTGVLVLLVPFFAHGVFDTLALSGMVDPWIGAACFFVLIFFCILMHKKCKKHIMTLLARDAERQNQENLG